MRRNLMQKELAFFCCALLAAAAAQGSAGPAPAAAEVDDLVRRAMATFSVPGVAVGVVEGGETILARGYGVLRHGEDRAVGPDTLFAIASNTKAFTTAALAILVDEGRLDWDSRVSDHLPELQLADPWVSRELTLRDLLTHRSGLGLGAGDLMTWPATDFTRPEILARLRHLRFETSFRSAYAYDNQLYNVAGELLGRVTGKSWEDWVSERILDRLGLTPCAVTLRHVKGTDDVATPHAVVDGELRAVSTDRTWAGAPAGGMWCNARGMTRWLALHLAGGVAPGGERLFSQQRHAEMWTPQTLLPVSEEKRDWHRTHFAAYGLGWRLEDFDGHLRVGHTGTVPGMMSMVGLLPELGVGVVVLTNQESPAAREAIVTQILKSYTARPAPASAGAEPRDWVAVLAERQAAREREAAAAVARAMAARPAEGSRPSLPPAAYAGTYTDAWRGDVWIREEDGVLEMEFSRTDKLRGLLEHFQHDTFIVRWQEKSLKADAYVKFELGFDGRVEGATMKPVSPLTDFSYDFQDLRLVRREGD